MATQDELQSVAEAVSDWLAVEVRSSSDALELSTDENADRLGLEREEVENVMERMAEHSGAPVERDGERWVVEA